MDHVSKSGDELMKNKTLGPWGSSIKQVRKIFQKTNISNPLIAHVGVRNRESEILVFQKILRTYLMGGPLFESPLVSKSTKGKSGLQCGHNYKSVRFFCQKQKLFIYIFRNLLFIFFGHFVDFQGQNMMKSICMVSQKSPFPKCDRYISGNIIQY